MPDFLIRNAIPDDAEAIATTHVASWKATYRGVLPDGYLDSLTTEDRIGMWQRMLTLTDARISVLIAAVQGRVAGFASTGPSRDSTTGELYAIYIDPRRVRRGIGTRLLSRAKEAMQEAGFESAILWVARDNPAAQAFYEGAGWVPDGVEKQDEVFGQLVAEVRYTKRLG